MPLNLIEDRWIPVRRQSGAREMIAPWEVTAKHHEDPIVAVDSPRPDFDGALTQFLIGIVQTAYAPADGREWRQRYDSPPATEALCEAFAPYSAHFNLTGDGARFAQDLTLGDEASREPIAQLFIDQSGADHFAHSYRICLVCEACAASALYTLQINAPAGGRGHRTSLRGGGPLTTVILGSSLWTTVWLNTLTCGDLAGLTGDVDLRTAEHIFPWLTTPRTSESTGRVTTPGDASPLQMYWSTPRRIRIDVSTVAAGICDVCGTVGDTQITEYLTRPLGVKYEGWVYPLTPYYEATPGEMLPVRGAAVGQPGYRHWVGWVMADDTERSVRTPARVVQEYLQRPDRPKRVGRLRLWAFGYDMNNMKPLAWTDSTMPLLEDAADTDLLQDSLRRLVWAAREVSKSLTSCLKSAWFQGEAPKADYSFVENAFWAATESAFYDAVDRLRSALPNLELAALEREDWLRTLRRVADQLFDEYSQNGAYDAVDPARISLAWRDLRRQVSTYNPKLRKLLMLPIDESQVKGRRTKKSAVARK